MLRRRMLMISEEVIPDYLCFTANTAGSTVSTHIYGTLTTTPTLEYSTDGTTWDTFTVGSTTVTLTDAGDKMYLRGDNNSFSESNSNNINFVMVGSIAASGNIMSLLDKTCQSVTIPNDYCFRSLFANCEVLTTAPTLPATSLTNYCYANLFLGCSGLATAPNLPATTLAEKCYLYMFSGCSNLAIIPNLSATILATSCYENMFKNCTSLTSIPQLVATTLAATCYKYMFRGCTGIKLSETQDTEYTTAYRVPTSGTGTTATNALANMFAETGGTFTGTPTINTTYYTSNTVV